MLNYKTQRMVALSEWDNLVEKTYSRPYSFQQQNGCKERGIFEFTVPDGPDDYSNETPSKSCMGVSFKSWLARDPKEPMAGVSFLDMWWERHFYPDVQMVANDLYERGLLEAGEYTINIDW